jgi:alpha-tubulin suppressor-like RCC1 family protein
VVEYGANRTIVLAGRNDFGQLTVPSVMWSGVGIGPNHTAWIVKDGGGLLVYGENDRNQSTVPPELQPNATPGIVHVSAGSKHTVVLLANGTIAAFGGSSGQSAAPQETREAGAVKAIRAGRYHSMALLSDGRVAVW